MVLTHLRRNVVAYLALIVALTTGTAYAAERVADGSVTTKKLAKNAVTSPKIKKNAVKSADVKDGALSRVDFAPGVLPGVTWVGGVTIGGGLPALSPDAGNIAAESFTLPRAGTLQITALFQGVALTCSVGAGHLGLYLDGVPVPGSRILVDSSPQPLSALGLVAVSKGPHQVTYGLDCPDGTASGYDTVLNAFTLVLGE